MTHRNHSPIRFLSFFISYFHFQFLLASSQVNFYQACNNNFSCGKITGIGYPFRSSSDPAYCGYPGLVLQCDGSGFTSILIENQQYRVLEITTSTKTMWIARDDVLQGNCPAQVQTTLDSSIFEFAGDYTNLTFLYGCSSNFPGVIFGSCFVEYGAQELENCRGNITYPVIQLDMGNGGSLNATEMDQILQKGFGVRWKMDDKACSVCVNSKGRCGYDGNRSVCFCPDLLYMTTTCSTTDGGSPQSAPSGGKGKSSTSINIILPIVGAVLAGIGFGWVIFYCRQRRKRLAVQSDHFSSTDKKELPTTPLANKDSLAPPASIAFTKSIPSYPSTKFDSRTETSFFGARIFTYTELEAATEDFAETRELGDGGFGAVYYGVLSDGSVVAVKRLYENNYKRVEQFKNEVEILTRLRHPNLVMLYGCSSKRSKDLLLVYEYVPNGTVADHLHGNRASSGLLSWPVRLNIAIETAEALAYLHASDIIHRDVKTNNILLDNDFHVKVADFGLSRLFPVDATHVSTAPQGTPGYVDPEYYQWYQLTEKSDVYSFGVVLVELISSLPAVDTNRSRQDINLASMAINKIQNHAVHELVDQSLQFHANSSVKKMVTLVAELAFRCLQQEKDMRPSMQEVLETLQGIQSGGLNAQKVEVVDILVDDCRSCKDGTLPPSPDSVTDKSTSTSAKTSSG